MPFRAPIERGAPSRRRWLVVAGVTALVLLDAVLIVWLIGRPTASEAESPAPTASPSSAASPSSEPSPSASPSAPAASEAVATSVPQRVLTAVDASVAWRAVTGECSQAVAAPEITTDAGASWRATDATGPTGATAVQRIMSASADVATMVAAAPDSCAPTIIRTYVRGDNYEEYPAEIETAWRIDPADRASIGTPDGIVDAPCGSIATIATASDASAAVLCVDGTMSTTADTGASWSAPLEVAGAQSLDAVEGGWLVARLGGSTCAGVGLAVVDPGGTTATEAGCVPVSGELESFAGEVAVSAGGGTWWVWVADALVRSTDGGATWR